MVIAIVSFRKGLKRQFKMMDDNIYEEFDIEKVH